MKRKEENKGKRGKEQTVLITGSDRKMKEQERERDHHGRARCDGNAQRQN